MRYLQTKVGSCVVQTQIDSRTVTLSCAMTQQGLLDTAGVSSGVLNPEPGLQGLQVVYMQTVH